jgi:hypothetical protein
MNVNKKHPDSPYKYYKGSKETVIRTDETQKKAITRLLKKKKFSDLSFSELTSLTIPVDKVQSYYDNMAHANKDIDENRGEYELAVKKLIAYRTLNKGLIEIVENSISGYEL